MSNNAYTAALTEKNIQALLMRMAVNGMQHIAALPNSLAFSYWEADPLTFTKSWFVHEFEIKTTPADLRADMKKSDKHWQFENTHRLERDTYGPTPNYFWYVTSFDIGDFELPHYAGWIRVRWIEPFHNDEGWWSLGRRREAPRLHSRKFPEKEREKLFRWLSLRVVKLYGEMYYPNGQEVLL